ncbi:AtzG-like protein [Hydrogenophaga sp. PBL-H3]|uniref:AtzG-like protein n=1 Tax=Hydrogenophaga sp. PBL-H3 TaxID=434010 RepID=UPI00131F8D8A|nr:AtzG-like protein [Hydrogenophaga sp. PBL-H3]QHE77720.1 DUF4089 domain-containing protein [Hydrogenophaga sp. PBL-H3]QHE82144.1 DUF4089 domain-containing protein [Hydrogenophaga sp. PBL-H3]
MTEEQTLAYVQAASVAVALPLNEAQAQRVATHLQRTAALAALLDAFELEVDDEPAEIYCPAPFQPSPH